MGTRNGDRLIVVTGATGKQGGATARHLLQKGFQVRGVTRDPASPAARSLGEAGASLIQGDLDDRTSLDAALEGADGAFSVQNFWETGYEREIEQGIRFADAASAAGIGHFVYASVGSAHRDTGLSHFESKWKIENHIRGLGLPYTVLRPVFFMENWEGPFLRPSILSGTLALPLDRATNFQQIAVDDIGSIAASAFEDPDRWVRREVDLAGDEGSIADIAETFARVIGRPVAYNQVPWDDYRQAAGDEYHDMFRWFQDVGYDVDVPGLRSEFAQLTSFADYLKRHGWEGAEAAG
ncbi:MAG: NmrA/HSCARG family protein [Gemmatimonadota bacterium]